MGEVFLCPNDVVAGEAWRQGGTWQFDQTDKLSRANFAGRPHLSYSFAVPYPSPAAAADGFEWRDSLNSTFAVAADINPGAAALEVHLESTTSEMQRGNSRNHNGHGQNVLYADGSVRFAQAPFAGPLDDNIWTSGWSGDAKPGQSTAAGDGGELVLAPAVLEALPVHARDVVMMPLDDLAMREAAESARFWRHVRENLLLPAGLVVILSMAGLVVWQVRTRRRRRSEVQ